MQANYDTFFANEEKLSLRLEYTCDTHYKEYKWIRYMCRSVFCGSA